MKQRSFSMILLFALFMALGSALVVSQRASAACYDSQKNPVPCPQQPNDKKKKPTLTDVPATPTATATKELSSQVTVLVTPDASQLAALCANLPAGAASTGGANPGNPPSPNAPTTPPTSSGFGLGSFELGGGGLLLGVLIGLLLPAVTRGFNGGIFRGVSVNGDGRTGYTGDGNFTGPITSPGDEKFTGGVFDKRGEAGLNYSKQGEAGMDDWERGGSVGGQGQAGMQDFHQKASGFSQKAEGNFPKQGDAGMADGSVHNMDSQFQKGSDAGITDGTSFTGNG